MVCYYYLLTYYTSYKKFLIILKFNLNKYTSYNHIMNKNKSTATILSSERIHKKISILAYFFFITG